MNLPFLIQGMAILTLVLSLNYTLFLIKKDIKKTQYAQHAYYTTIHNIVDNEFIKNNYTFTGIVCTDTRRNCWLNNLTKFYNPDGKIKYKYVVYFLSDKLNFDFKSKWYLNPENVQDLYSKLRVGVYIPPPTAMGEYTYISNYYNYSRLIKNNTKYVTEWIISPFWFK